MESEEIPKYCAWCGEIAKFEYISDVSANTYFACNQHKVMIAAHARKLCWPAMFIPLKRSEIPMASSMKHSFDLKAQQLTIGELREYVNLVLEAGVSEDTPVRITSHQAMDQRESNRVSLSVEVTKRG